jgi:hypothetical protein
MKTDRRLYLDSSGKRIVEGPPEAAVLFKVKGAPVSQAELDLWGDKLRKYVPDAKTVKQQEKAQDKSTTPTANKGPGRPRKTKEENS